MRFCLRIFNELEAETDMNGVGGYGRCMDEVR